MKYVALDIGNVLVHADFRPFLRQLSKSLNLTLEEAHYFMNRTQTLHDLGCTHMADELRDHFKVKSPVIIEELSNHWNDIIIPSEPVIDQINMWRKEHGLQVALLSNVGLEHAVRMEKVLDRGGFFGDAVKHFSCHVGARKPTYLYYQSFLRMHPEWKGCPYVDDLQENLNVGARFGFRPFRFSLEEIGTVGGPAQELGKCLERLEIFLLKRQ